MAPSLDSTTLPAAEALFTQSVPEAVPAAWLPVRMSQLPTADDLLPYLRRIDENRWYSNFGFLLREFEAKLAAHFDVDPDALVCVANGTLGLVGALTALEVRPGGLCVMPSWTFAATPAAAAAAGLRPYFMDVDPASWALDPAMVEAALPHLPESVAAVIVVSPFGAPVDPGIWDDFWERTGIPVVIDAAWGFDRTRVGRAPVMVSLHASKLFGVGEGGLVATRLPELARRIEHASNFGFDTQRVATFVGGNYKMSEYAAAIGLAMFERWPGQRARTVELMGQYVEAFRDVAGVALMPGFGTDWVGGACCLRFDHPVGEAEIDHFRRRGVEARRWWSKPCHRHPAFADSPQGPLEVTETLFETVIAVPFFCGMTVADVLRVRDAVVTIPGG